ncbi:MAG: redoxin domain-containing protein [Cytophagaceae bacterium]|nr:MAG: redoxin domain-containing protein [Cytophagaceae bacterium]
MKLFLLTQLLAALLFGSGRPNSSVRPAPPRQQRVTVYVFLAETCPISQQATLPLRELHARYAAQGVRLVGVFPGSTATAASLSEFGRKYAVPFPLQLDPGQKLTRRLKARITPEAVVVAADGHTILYQGRLNDQYAALGERRSLSQHHELADALADLAAGRPVAVPRTEAIGCFIEK